MSYCADPQSPPKPDIIQRTVGNIMVLIGILALATAVYQGVSASNIYNSPFDQVETAAESGLGFLPIVVDPNSESGFSAAPTLSSEEGVVIDQEKLDDVIDVIRAQLPVTGALNAEIFVPDRIVIPSINLDSNIVLADYKEIPFWGKVYKQWTAPSMNAVGWHYDSAALGIAGNTVLNGHHNIYGEVFRYLADIKSGSIIYLYSGEQVFSYIVVLVDIIPEKYQSVEERIENAQWTLPSQDERITLITCWPYESNTHRVVVVAVPIELDGPVP